LEWENNTGTTILIRDPRLTFHELELDGEPTGDELRFYAVDRLPGLSSEVLQTMQSNPATTGSVFPTSILVEPHSVAQSVLVFRVEGWFKPPNQCFRFIPGQSYRVDIQYTRFPEPPIWHKNPLTKTLVERLPIQTNVDFLNVYGPTHGGENSGWDYVSLRPGTRSMQGGTVPRVAPEHRYNEEPPCS
jgi:hypothetical protein